MYRRSVQASSLKTEFPRKVCKLNRLLVGDF